MKLGKWEALIHQVNRLCGEVETAEHQIEQIWVQLGRPFPSNRPQSVILPSNDWAWIAWGVFTVYDVCKVCSLSDIIAVKTEIKKCVDEVGPKPTWLYQGMLDYSEWVKNNSVDLASMRSLAITLQRLAEDKERPRGISNASSSVNPPVLPSVSQQNNYSEVGDSTGFLPSDLLPNMHRDVRVKSKTLKDVRISPSDVSSVSDAHSTTSASKQQQVNSAPKPTSTKIEPKSPARSVSKPRASTPSSTVKSTPTKTAPKLPARPVSKPRASTPLPTVKTAPKPGSTKTAAKSPARPVSISRASTPSPRVSSSSTKTVSKSPARSVSKPRASQSPKVRSTSRRGVSPAPSSRGRSASKIRIKKKK